jgi:hypothetical protein
LKTNLLIDGNYLLIKNVFFLFQEKTLYSELLLLLNKELEKLMSMHTFDNVYFISDSKFRWRKQILDTYKSNRVKDENIDWDKVYSDFNTFKEEINGKRNITSIEINYAEGDDIIAYITKESNKKEYSNVIVSSDGDLHQLLTFDLSRKFINIMYNFKYSDERVYVPMNYSVFMHEMHKNTISTLFDMDDDVNFLDFLELLIHKTKTVPVTNEEALFCKLISGDRGDCIPSVYIKNDRGIGSTGGLSLYKLYKETYQSDIDFNTDEFLNKTVDVISYSKKITDSDVKQEIKTNLVRNLHLIKLDEEYLPEDLRNTFKNKIIIR